MNRGFTVHSPFAYRFIRLVVRETLPYYDFKSIRDPYDRLLYRTAVYFNPATIAATGPQGSRALEILRKALPSARTVAPAEADFLFTDAPDPAHPTQFISTPQPPEILPAHTLFSLPGCTIAIRRNNLPPAAYPLSLH